MWCSLRAEGQVMMSAALRTGASYPVTVDNNHARGGAASVHRSASWFTESSEALLRRSVPPSLAAVLVCESVSLAVHS